MAAALQASAGSFEGAVDRLDGHLQHLGHLAGVEPEDVAQDEDGDLARRKQLQGGHEGQRDGFALLVAGLWPERLVDGVLEERVRKRLQPDGLVARGRQVSLYAQLSPARVDALRDWMLFY